MKRDIHSIVRNFGITEDILDIFPVTTGHINDSFRIVTSDSHRGYFLQWVNSYIFKDIEGLMKNILLVTDHIAKNTIRVNGNSDQRFLELIPSLQGKYCYQDENNEYWRLFRNIPETHVYDIVENESIAFEGGKAFGRFLSTLADLPSDLLRVTIPDFHNVEKRLEKFYHSLEQDPSGRKKDINPEIDFIQERSGKMLEIPRLMREGKIPLRITHNDTKFNNILFNRDNKAVCIVDLDTVMPGSVLFDYGDAIRTGANTVCEDEKDLNRVDIDLSIYGAYTRGFIQETRNSLVPAEIEHLAFSAQFMTYIIGLRFLTDFVDGDPYFRTNYPTHNLDRARVQFRLIQAMEKKASVMESIVINAFANT